MPRTMPAQPRWLSAASLARPVGVDRKAGRILGYVVAQEGPFREPDPRGEFDLLSLRRIVGLMEAKPRGTKVRFGHPGLSSDGVGTYLGRAVNPRLDAVTVERGGKAVRLRAVRADLHFSESAGGNNPNGNLREYLLGLAEEDPAALGSSLVVEPEEEVRLNGDGTPQTDQGGNRLPPLWRPRAIHASDIVDEGAAVDGLLSAGVDVDALPDALQRQGWAMLDRLFAGQPRDVVEARVTAYLQRYLSARYGKAPCPPPQPPLLPAPDPLSGLPTPKLDAYGLRMAELDVALRRRGLLDQQGKKKVM